MNIGLFKKPYVVRRHGKQAITAGYASAPYDDMVQTLNVQRLNPDELQAKPEGSRSVAMLKSFGHERLTAANDYDGVPADLLYYRGLWYECTSSFLLDNTPLGHYRSEFALLPECDQPKPPKGASV